MDAHRLLVTEAEKVSAIDRDRAAVLMAAAVMACGMSGQIARGVATGRRAVELAGDGPARLFANVLLAINTAVAGEPQSHDILISSQRALEQANTPEAFQLSGVIAHVLMFLEEYDESMRMLDRIVAARDRGILDSHPLAARADVEFRLGRWAAAHADAAQAVDVARETGQRSMLPFALVTLARVEAATGREADCRAHVAETIELLTPFGADSAMSYAWAVVGLLELGYGRFEHAIEPLARVAQHTELGHPNVLQWAPDLIEAYARTDRRFEAGVVLAHLERDSCRVGGTWPQAVAARCRGLLASDTDFEKEFVEALDLHDRTPTPFDRGRTELCYGERLRRVGRRIDAREHLRAALTIFESLGAEPWAEQARAELRATGERVRKREDITAAQLTAQELQVAVLVAEGGTNREVGARLMLSPRTIEFHLRNVYAKLGVRSRTELAIRLAGKTAKAITMFIFAQAWVLDEGIGLGLIG
jgi:DNA-binding CsgD family transcriptional regulator